MSIVSNERPPGRLYGAVWRWHFYAGLLVVPFVCVLAVTGTIYLFERELNDLIYPELRFVEPGRGPSLGPDALIARALATHPGASASRIDLPGTPDRSAVVFLEGADGADLRAHLDPATGEALGDLVYGRTLVGVADVMHGSLFLGWIGDRIVETAACWAVVLVVTGFYLWWPRGRTGLGGTLVPRLGRRGRGFWRDLHAVSGAYAALGIVFLVMTGLPWAGLWGDLLTRTTNAIGAGYPAELRDDPPGSTPPASAARDLPWTLEAAPVPVSTDPASHHPEHGSAGDRLAGGIGADEVAQVARNRGVPDGYRLTLPDGARGVWTVGYFPDRPEGQRTLHVDRYSGAVLADLRYEDYGAVAKPVELGIAIHMGNYFGRANQALMASIALLILTLAVTGTVMWWRRRPRGRLGAPPAAPAPRARGVVAIAVGLGVLFPLVGLSLLAVLALDLLLIRRVPALRRALG